MTNVDSLKSAFESGLGLDSETVQWPLVKYREIPEWDSVGHMALVAEIEDKFGIMLDVDDVIAMSSFEIAQQILGKYGVEFD